MTTQLEPRPKPKAAQGRESQTSLEVMQISRSQLRPGSQPRPGLQSSSNSVYRRGNPPALQVSGLTKTFGKGKNTVKAVRGVDFEVTSGQVYGFLGPNGAGKSTTIRMIMDLIKPTAGRVQIFGQDVSSGSAEFGRPTFRQQELGRVGALVEGAMFYEHLTGRRNLEVLARTQGRYRPQEIDSLLERLGMADRADRPVQGYSMGMKQRLGVVAALLGKPRLVILDEPTNGLDPAGIREMRTFIRQLADQDGMTVFLSSHLLAEIEQVCDRVAIIDRGRIVRQGRVDELLADQERLRLEVSHRQRAAQILGSTWACETAKSTDTTLRLNVARETTPEVIRRLTEAQIDIFEAHRERRSLEDFFLEVTTFEEPRHGTSTKEIQGDCHV